ncbi:MAG TPA: hypothetical protein DEQ40_09040 [Oxalobacteraceae bacterium]|jgi:hypothetical protein|nr:hypothetical protein [Oxalobacteraceae bacterium]
MKIDIPIVILFDCNDYAHANRAKSAKQCTLRVDTEDANVPNEIFDHYPPRDDAVAKNLGEPADGVMAMMSRATWDAIKKAAARNPYDYLVGTDEERDIAQEEADEARAANGQFGAGS